MSNYCVDLLCKLNTPIVDDITIQIIYNRSGGIKGDRVILFSDESNIIIDNDLVKAKLYLDNKTDKCRLWIGFVTKNEHTFVKTLTSNTYDIISDMINISLEENKEIINVKKEKYLNDENNIKCESYVKNKEYINKLLADISDWDNI